MTEEQRKELYWLDKTQVGQTVTLALLRQGRERTVKLSQGAFPSATRQ